MYFYRVVLGLLAIVGFAHNASAHSYSVGALNIIHPTAQSIGGSGNEVAVYLTIENRGQEQDSLRSITSDAAIKGAIYKHLSDSPNAAATTVDWLELPAGQTALLVPNGDYIALSGLKVPMKKGDSLNVTLTFQGNKQVQISAHFGDVPANGRGHDLWPLSHDENQKQEREPTGR